jgi:hypothetical protein
VTVSDHLETFYEGYYGQSDDLEVRRSLAARDSVDHLRNLVGMAVLAEAGANA